jgi:hypothetical protein
MRIGQLLTSSRKAKVSLIVAGLVAVTGGVVGATVSADQGSARADAASKGDFVSILSVNPNVTTPSPGQSASTGTFTVDCGKNENNHRNPDNFIAQAGVKNGAQHLHDYVGNVSTNADSTDAELAAAGTTCKNEDKSTYYWPVLRIDTGDETSTNPTTTSAGQQAAVNCPAVAGSLPTVPAQADAEVKRNLALLDSQIAEADQRIAGSADAIAHDPNFIGNAILGPLRDKRTATLDRIAIAIGRSAPKPDGLTKLATCTLSQGAATASDAVQGGNQELAGNDGVIQVPTTISLQFRGNATSAVRPMPQFLRILTGDAKVFANGPANARAAWTCTGFENRLISKYPICPQGSRVERIHDFPSCWDGRNLDSANHRTHIVFPNAQGACANGFVAVPQLRIALTYDIPTQVQRNGQYKVDSFPEAKHDPFSDHDDFENVMTPQLMSSVVSCIDNARRCHQ